MLNFTPLPSDNAMLLASAKSGDEHAFAQLTEPLQRELRVHCYRMLGTLHDADDALQETLIRAWRQLDRFEPRAPIRAWLYRIATNVCLTAIERRSRRGEVPLTTLESKVTRTLRPGAEQLTLQPLPDHLLTFPDSVTSNPELRAEAHESITLAFIAAVQLLPARQRAVLLLREVIGYSAAEVADMLGTSVASVNSALQRARATLALEQKSGTVARNHVPPSATKEQALVLRFVDAWQSADVEAIVAILTEDALFAMPPQPEHYVGKIAIADFLATVPARGRLDRFRFIPTRANAQPAVAAYRRPGDDGPFEAHGVIVIACAGERIDSLTRFEVPSLFARFGLPRVID